MDDSAADTLRRVYGAGQTLNDHFVAVVVLAGDGFYGLLGRLRRRLKGASDA